MNFLSNMAAAINGVSSGIEIIVVVEDDDWMAVDHIERTVDLFSVGSSVLACGDPRQRYYHVGHRVWKIFNNIGSSMCQTAFSSLAAGLFSRAIIDCVSRSAIGLDRKFWDSIPPDRQRLVGLDTVVGIKGLPGQVGLGVGHRPRSGWEHDSSGSALRQFIGSDADIYAQFAPAAV